MNYNLISPDGEGQNFRVKFQEPIVLPPDAKISLNYAVFERNSVFDFTEDQKITLLVLGNTGNQTSFQANFYGGMGDIYPRLPLVQDSTAGNIAVAKTPTQPINNNTPLSQTEMIIRIPKDHYTLESLNFAINKALVQKNFTAGNLPFEALQFFGQKEDGSVDLPDANPNGLIHLPNQTNFIPSAPNDGGLQFGFVKNAFGDGNYKFMRFSTQHLINGTNVEQAGATTNSFTPNANNAEYNAYALSRDRLFHFGNVYDLDFHTTSLIGASTRTLPELSCEGFYVSQTSEFMVSATTKQTNLDGTYLGKDFFGLYSIDYAGLTNENQTNGTGLSSAVNTTRKGRDESAGVHTPPTNEVIADGDLKLTTTLGANKEVPKCFFGVEFLDDATASKTRMNIYMTESATDAWRHAEIKDQKLIYTALLDNIVGLDHKVGSDELFVGIHFIENVDKLGKVNVRNVNSNQPVYFPLVFLGASSRGTAMCVFDGRFHNFGGVLSSKLSGYGGSFLRQDTKPLSTDGLSYRGSDLPFAPIFAGNNTTGGWKTIRGTFFNETNKGTLNSATDPLRGAYFIREHGYFCDTQIANDLFGLYNANDAFNYNSNVANYKFFSRPFYPINTRQNLINWWGKKFDVDIPNLKLKSSVIYNITDIAHSYKNDRYTIYINLPTKAFANIADKSKPGIRKNILSHAPLVFSSNLTDDTETAISGIKVIAGGYAPSLGITQHLDNKHIITTNFFEIEVRNMNDDTPATQLHKTIVNFSVFA